MAASSIEASLTQVITFSECFGMFSTIVSLLVVSFGRLLCNFGIIGVVVWVVSGYFHYRVSQLNFLWQWSEDNHIFFLVWWVLFSVGEIY